MEEEVFSIGSTFSAHVEVVSQDKEKIKLKITLRNGYDEYFPFNVEVSPPILDSWKS